MNYRYFYKTPDGLSDIWMSSDGEFLTGLWFDCSADISKHNIHCEEKMLPIFQDAIKWLDIYFSGKTPDFTPAYRIGNLTPFRQEVIDAMLAIPFGKTKTYGEIAGMIAEKHGIARMSARAVGGAVGWNPICIIIPCHRVVGANNALTGYGGGMMNKIALLKHENHDMSKYRIPEKREEKRNAVY